MPAITRLWLGVLFYVLFLTYVKPEERAENTNRQTNKCDVEECQHMRDRLATLETAVKTIVSALAFQKNRLFAPINTILERDSALRSIIFPSSSHTKFPNKILQTEVNDNGQNENNATSELKRAMQCSLTPLLDINFSEKSEMGPSGKIKAKLGLNNSLEVEWTPYSDECLKSSSGVWIRVFESGKQPSLSDTYLAIPQKCLKKRSNASFNIVLPPSSLRAEKKPCYFELKEDLIQCRSYTVEVVPNYQSLKGRPIFINIVIPSTDAKLVNLNSLISAKTQKSPYNNHDSSTLSLVLDWKDNSGCAPQLSSFSFKIFPDGDVLTDPEVKNTFVKIPRNCLNQLTDTDNNSTFSVSLSPSNQACPAVKWKSLDACRKYTFKTKSEYSEVWTGAPTLWDIFTTLTGSNPQGDSSRLNCPAGHVFCERDYHGNLRDNKCISVSHVCDKEYSECQNRADENYCELHYNRKFQCGKQYISYSNVCDGTVHCIDGSDEPDVCGYFPLTCNQVTAKHGHFSSKHSSRYLNDVSLLDQGRPTFSLSHAVLITVEFNHTIWLDFKKFNSKESNLLVYDGPFSTSRLLLSYNGSTSPSPIRSSKNELYIQFPSLRRESIYNYDRYSYEVEVSYTSMNNTQEAFVPGCGGYVYGDGVVFTPINFNESGKLMNCTWFVEANDGETAVLLKRYVGTSTKSTENLLLTDDISPNVGMTIYDGWSSSGQVFYNGPVSSPEGRSVFYSDNNKILVQFRPQDEVGEIVDRVYYWNVYSVSEMECEESLREDTGTIKSPNYPESPYPNLVDCRWKIVTALDSKIRLLFAFFKTQEDYDYVYVYDGLTMDSPLLLEKSGSALLPFTVNSSSNQMFIRFTTDESSTFPGFLAVYSTV